MASADQKIPVIREQTLEHIARYLGDLTTGWKIVLLLKSLGVPETLTNYSGSKWWMVLSVLKHYAYSTEEKDKEMLFKIICETLHPLMYNGDEQAAKTAADDFNKYLQYDDLAVGYDDDEKIYLIGPFREPTEAEKQDILQEFGDELFEKEQNELQFFRLPENREKISTFRKAYQVFMNITEVFCDNPSRPSQELNDVYVKTKKLIIGIVNNLYLNVSSVDGVQRMHNLTHFCIPFNNLFTAEKEYTPDSFDIDLTGKKLNWDYIRPRMNATYGDIDELYRKVEGSDILSKPDVQQTLNDVSLLLSKTKEDNKKRTEAKQKASEPQIPVQKIEITAMPELQIRNAEDNTFTKGKKRIHLPKFKPTDWAKITIRFLDERNILITSDKKELTPADYETLGFADEKRGKPNLAWKFFYGLAQNNGETNTLPTPIPDNIKQQKRQLSDRLKTIFKNDTDPFHDPTETHIYRIKINLISSQTDEEPDKYGTREYLKKTMTEEYEEKYNE